MSRENNERDMRPEYDIRGGVRGKYFEPYRQGTTVSVKFEDSPFIAESTAGTLRLCGFTCAASYSPPLPSPTIQLGTLEAAASGR